MGPELGVDDYVTKPFIPRELHARMKVALRQPAYHFDAEPLPIPENGVDTYRTIGCS